MMQQLIRSKKYGTGRRIIAALAVTAAVSLAHAQYLGPIGPGEASLDGNAMQGRLADWQREATPTLVLSAPGNRVLRVFADIASDGSFALVLPAIADDTPLGSTVCGEPGKPPITVLFDVELLTPLKGFTTPDELHRGLSVIGMALLADAEFATNIGAPGTRRVQWFASREARTVAVGECNNDNAFDLLAGWTPVTLVSGPSGGPHTYHPGIEEGMGWYWWAFPEPPEAP